MKYLAVLGRQSNISLAELEALFDDVQQISPDLAEFESATPPNINRLGGSLKLAVKLDGTPLDYFRSLAATGKLTLGLSDYSSRAATSTARLAAMKLKKILVRHGHSVRIVEGHGATLPTATSLHNGLSGNNPKKCEFIKTDRAWYRALGVQDIDAYTRRDQARPARDAKVGMLPPKLAQILINLCGPLPAGSTILDPFCGTGVVLQEALLMGYHVYGTDLSDRMIDYTKRNLAWLVGDSGTLPRDHTRQRERNERQSPVTTGASERVEGQAYRVATSDGREGARRGGSVVTSQGDATSFQWTRSIDAIAAEGYLGQPMSEPPAEIKLKTEMQECGTIVTGFLKNLAPQITTDTPVTIAIPAWLRPDGTYSRIFTPEMVDFITNLGYNVSNKSREGLLYYRNGQVVARDIIMLRKV